MLLPLREINVFAEIFLFIVCLNKFTSLEIKTIIHAFLLLQTDQLLQWT